MKPGVVFDDLYAAHAMGPAHVESPERILVLNRMLEAEPPGRVIRIEPRPATEAELAWVHDKGYIDFLRTTAGRDEVRIDADTSTCPKTYETARLAAGGFLRAVDFAMDGRAAGAFALVRPPGHHAEAGRAMGFCFFNNAAVAAEYLIRRHGLRRVLVVDFDLHHGNGVQRAFYARSDVLYFSVHQAPLFPGTGALRETGDGPGKGFNLNVPLGPGKGDAEYLHVFGKILRPVAARFRPEFILVSAGFDIAAGDPLGGMRVSRKGFGLIADSLSAMAAESCPGRLAYVLEGGYDLGALRDGVREVLDSLGRPAAPPPPGPEISEEAQLELAPCFQVFRSYWDI